MSAEGAAEQLSNSNKIYVSQVGEEIVLGYPKGQFSVSRDGFLLSLGLLRATLPVKHGNFLAEKVDSAIGINGKLNVEMLPPYLANLAAAFTDFSTHMLTSEERKGVRDTTEAGNMPGSITTSPEFSREGSRSHRGRRERNIIIPDQGEIPMGYRLRALRRGREITLNELARQIGYKGNTISQAELNSIPASGELVDSITKAFGLTSEELLKIPPAILNEWLHRRPYSQPR